MKPLLRVVEVTVLTGAAVLVIVAKSWPVTMWRESSTSCINLKEGWVASGSSSKSV